MYSYKTVQVININSLNIGLHQSSTI